MDAGAVNLSERVSPSERDGHGVLDRLKWPLITNRRSVSDGSALTALATTVWPTCIDDLDTVRTPVAAGVGVGVAVAVGVGVGVGVGVAVCRGEMRIDSRSRTAPLALASSLTYPFPDEHAIRVMDAGAVNLSERVSPSERDGHGVLDRLKWPLITNRRSVSDGSALTALATTVWPTCIDDLDTVRTPVAAGVGVGVAVAVGVGVGVAVAVLPTVMVVSSNRKSSELANNSTVPVPAPHPSAVKLECTKK